MKTIHPWSESATIAVLLTTGLVLAVVRLLLLLFPLYNLLDAGVYFGFAYLFGRKVEGHRWPWGLLLAGPAVALSLYFLITIGNLQAPMAVRHALAVVLLPLAACGGIYLRLRSWHRHTLLEKHLLED